VADKHPTNGEPSWIQLPIAQAQLLGAWADMPRYCETPRCRGKRQEASTFHALINVPGAADCAWVACAGCTGLMMEVADTT